MNIEHHVGGRIVFYLFLIKLFITEKLEGHREDVGYSLDKKLLDVIYDLFEGLAVEESFLTNIFYVDFNSKIKIVLKYLVSGVQHVFEFLPVLHLLFGSIVADGEVVPICCNMGIDFRSSLGLEVVF